ncbi:MAG: sugar kinase [Furfurilactobacillus sp.]|jgi:2-dehydro-3-deoxygluconokinase|uniref:sugar kinase n=1 Tax=Furfurilactobacillus TaxID=2767882 RepID=UPI001F1784B9|nr:MULTISPECIES: sugar kinase [Furfurilactobacillus]MCF6418613.1 sugar kinase [Furfurilactobacillus milii]MCH4012075.1 sugar kinase [Furfurilactobacillus sp.]MCH4037967.1 sugar kinase [Furfurilactobacillus sp.]MCH4115396.1 sugar kinase [Furfurilactobacillus sp.]MCH4134203.1 sugar kinase [Furfurilactobacillus sp.]
MSEFLTIGEPMVVLASQDINQELADVSHFNRFLAGAELNVATGVRRLGHSTSFVSAIGNDPFGQYILDAIRLSGIDTTHIKINSKLWTGFYLKQRVSHGDPETYYFRKNSAAANYDKENLAHVDLTDTRITHISGIFAALSPQSLAATKELIAKVENENCVITFDPNLRPSLWQSENTMIATTNELAKHGTVVMPGIHEGQILMGSDDPVDIANFYLNQSSITQTVVVKLGPDGAFVKERNRPAYTVAGFHVNSVIDTVGAGDGFAVGIISALLEGKEIKEAVKRACAIGALAVESRGDNDGYPTRNELKRFYEKNNRQVGEKI